MTTSNKLLDNIKNIEDIRNFSLDDLEQLSKEVRQETIDIVANVGGHLGASLGVVELTIALHHVFNTPKDLLVWDIGHQSLPHKIITDRRHLLSTFRKPGGISGFTKRLESVFDCFGAGHSSTSISAALGMAVARDLANEKNEVIAIIGDGSLSAGMAYEAMNNAGFLKNRMIVILNDNEMSISQPVGAMTGYLARLISSKEYLGFRKVLKNILKYLPNFIKKLSKKFERLVKDCFVDRNIFEELGFYYVGPIDGHNLAHLLPVLKNIRDDQTINKPILIHVVTEKAKGFNAPNECSEKFHTINKFDPQTFAQSVSKQTVPTYTEIFAESLLAEAKIDEKIVAITAAMPTGTGLNKFAKEFPSRCFDVGIAEQHAVTFAAGLACSGYKPFVALYSTFLQRAYDQVVHDVAIQNLPVRFAIDRAGYVGIDGATHAGSFDIMFLASLPNMVVMAPSDEAELKHMVTTALSINDGPSAFRYPRGAATGIELPTKGEILPIGKGRIIKKGQKIAILSLGTRLNAALKAADLLKDKFDITVADARFAKPIDIKLIRELATSHEMLITLEEGSIGGFGSHVLDFLTKENLLEANLKFYSLHYPDIFVEQDNVDALHKQAGLEAEEIALLINKKFAIKQLKAIMKRVMTA